MEISESKIPWSLASRTDSDEIETRRKKIPLSSLINSLNRINFKNGDILLKFKHKKYHNFTALKAKPQTCNNTCLECLWSEPFRMQTRLKFYDLEYLSFTDGLNQIQVHANLVDHNDDGLILELPEYSYEIKLRAVKRHPCNDVSAQISQDGSVVTGTLLNFCAESFAVEYHSESSQVNLEINPENPANVVLIHRGEFLFSGKCTIIRQQKRLNTSVIVFKPEKDNIRRMKSKEHRMERLVLSPLPNLIFRHPFTQKNILLGLNDISGLGFSVEEDSENSVLLPGLIIPRLEIEFIHGLSIFCRAQVLYRIPKEDVVRCGLVILDMNIQDHIKLSSLIYKAKNKYSYIGCSNVDLEALWDFFFDSGFVYPEKYLQLAEQKDKFINTYKKIYNENPEIVQHIIYQDKGKIYGHISICRYYRKTWLLHHLAAIRSPKHRAGLVVLEHILQHINELHSLPTAHMSFLAGYFRDNNRFSNRLFGTSATGAMDDPKKSSIDEFSYFYFHAGQPPAIYSNEWVLGETDCEDLQLLKQWYDTVSGGLLIDALDLDPESYSMDESICRDYQRAGLKRERKIFSLKKNDELLAILTANISDFGINLSNLTNCIQIFVLDQRHVHKNILNFAITQLLEHYENKTVPVLLYPKSCADQYDYHFEKTYLLGILNLEHIGEYLKFMDSLIVPKTLPTVKHTK
jgi:hypothetical protein